MSVRFELVRDAVLQHCKNARTPSCRVPAGICAPGLLVSSAQSSNAQSTTKSLTLHPTRQRQDFFPRTVQQIEKGFSRNFQFWMEESEAPHCLRETKGSASRGRRTREERVARAQPAQYGNRKRRFGARCAAVTRDPQLITKLQLDA